MFRRVLLIAGLVVGCESSPSGQESPLGGVGGPGDGSGGEGQTGGSVGVEDGGGTGASPAEKGGGGAGTAGSGGGDTGAGGERDVADQSSGGDKAVSTGGENGKGVGGADSPAAGGASAGGSEGSGSGGEDGTVNPSPLRVLVFSATAEYRHESIAQGVTLIESLAGEEGWELSLSEDASVFTAAAFADTSCVVFLNTTGDILNAAQESAFEAWFAAGGAFVGIHAATDTEYDWPFYSQLVGAQFKSHPAVQMASIFVEDATHPSTAHLGASWNRTDEWYDFLANPRDGVHVLLSLEESSYEGGTMGADHPIAWSQEIGAGRSFYTGLGHTADGFSESDYVEHIRGGMRWALRVGE